MGARYGIQLYVKMLDHLALTRNTMRMMAWRLELLPSPPKAPTLQTLFRKPTLTKKAGVLDK